MNLHLELPSELAVLLNPDPERHILESVLLRLIRQEKISVARAEEILGLARGEAVKWYSSQGYLFPEFDATDRADELKSVQFFQGFPS